MEISRFIRPNLAKAVYTTGGRDATAPRYKGRMTVKFDGLMTAAALVTMFALSIWPLIRVQTTVREPLHVGCMPYYGAQEKRFCQGIDHPTGGPTQAIPFLPHAYMHVVGESHIGVYHNLTVTDCRPPYDFFNRDYHG